MVGIIILLILPALAIPLLIQYFIIKIAVKHAIKEYEKEKENNKSEYYKGYRINNNITKE